MKSLYEAFGTDGNLETDGVVLDFGSAKFKVRRAGGSNRRYASILTAKLRQHKRAIGAGTFTDEQSAEVLHDVYSDAVMVSWEGVQDREGQPMPYNKVNFCKLMKDLPDLWSAIRDESENMRNFQFDSVADAGEKLGND